MTAFRPGEQAAIEAAAQAAFKRDYAPMGAEFAEQHAPEKWHRELAERCVAAAYPLIAAAVAEEVAEQIEVRWDAVREVKIRDAYNEGEMYALDIAEQIARGYCAVLGVMLLRIFWGGRRG